jgi:succinate dehydrogenase / fumarate reductase, cytochrome b subunit
MSTAAPAAIPADHSFFWRRLHSLTGIFPIGFFLLEHMFSNAFVLRSAEAYNNQVAFLVGLPLVLLFEVFFIWIPILFHGSYGVYIWWRGEPNMAAYPWTGNWLYSVQRYSGLAAFVFIVIHVYTQRFTGTNLLENPEQAFAKVSTALANPAYFGLYVIGILAVTFHFAYGLWLFGCKWGITPGMRAQRISGYLCASIGVGLGVLSLVVLAAFR